MSGSSSAFVPTHSVLFFFFFSPFSLSCFGAAGESSSAARELTVTYAPSGTSTRVLASASETVADVKSRLALQLGVPAKRQILLFEYVNLPASQPLDVVFAAAGDVSALVQSLTASLQQSSSTSVNHASSSSTLALPAAGAAAAMSVYLFDSHWVLLDACPTLPPPPDVDDVPDAHVAAPPSPVAPGVAAAAVARERALAVAVARVNGLRRRLELLTERCGVLLREQAGQRAAIEATVKNLIDFHIDRVVRGVEKTSALIEHHVKEQARVLETFDADAHKLELIALHAAVASPRFRTLADLVDVAGYRLRADSSRQLADQLTQKLAACAQLVKQSQADAAAAAQAIEASLVDAAPFHSQLARLRDAASSAVALEARLHAMYKTARATVERGGAVTSGDADANEIGALQPAVDEARALYARCVATRQTMCAALFDAMRREKPIAELVDKAKLELGGIRPALRKWRTDIARLHDVRRYPIVYVDSLAEVARRRAYAQSAQQRFVAFAGAFSAAHDAELNRRRLWNRSNLRFVAPLFPAPAPPGSASPALGSSSLADLARLSIEAPELDTTLPRIEHQDAVRAAAAYGIALGDAAALDSGAESGEDGDAAPAPAAVVAQSAAPAAAAAAESGELQVYQQRIKELEERLEEQFARAQIESMDKSMSDATSAQLRRARRAQLDAEKQVSEIGERLAAAVARAAAAERQLAEATAEHERLVRDLSQNSGAIKERDEARAERDAARVAAVELERERDHFVQVVAAANQARTKSQQAASESRAMVESLQAQLAVAEARVHELEAARAESVVEVDEVRASRERMETSVAMAERRASSADQRADALARELADERVRRARYDDALKSVVSILGHDGDDGAAEVADAAITAAQQAAMAVERSKVARGGDTLQIGIGALKAGDVGLFIPRVTREAAGAVPAQYVYEAVTLQSGSLSSLGDGHGGGGETRFFLDGNAIDAFQREVELKLPIVGEIVECTDENGAADAPSYLAFLKPNERYALVIVSRV